MREDDIQRAVFSHIRQRGGPRTFAFHPKNGGIHQRGRRRGINSGLGVVSGVPDVIILHDARMYALELKTGTGKLSEEQIRVLEEMETCGAIIHVAHGLDAALSWLEERGILRGRAS